MSDQSDQLPDTTTDVLNESKDSLAKFHKATVVLTNEDKLNAEQYGKLTKSQVFSGVKRKPRRLHNSANKVKTSVHSGSQETRKRKTLAERQLKVPGKYVQKEVEVMDLMSSDDETQVTMLAIAMSTI